MVVSAAWAVCANRRRLRASPVSAFAERGIKWAPQEQGGSGSERIAEVAQPGVLFRGRHHVGLNRVEFDVTFAGEEMAFGLGYRRTEAAFEERAGPPIGAANVLSLEVPEALGEQVGFVPSVGPTFVVAVRRLVSRLLAEADRRPFSPRRLLATCVRPRARSLQATPSGL